MSGNMYGADIEALRQLADQIARGGEALEGVVGIVESAMPTPEQWNGFDAEGFREEWSGTHAPAITTTAQALAEVAMKVRENADAQESTSEDTGGLGSGGGSGGGGGGGGGGSWGGTSGEGSGESDWRDSVPDLPDSIRDIIDVEGTTGDAGGLFASLLGLKFPEFAKGMGGVFSVAGLVTGSYQYIDSGLDFLREGGADNLYSAGDGYVAAALAAGTLFGGPAAPAFAIAGGVWAGASLINGLVSDRPLTQNLIDYVSPVGLIYNAFSDTNLSDDIAGIADSAVDKAGEVVGDVVDAGGDLIEGAGDLLGF
ncbi:hypothetical protein [Myceligenerans crystallogenes]|uniref:WXG100 family type VII secretion target n=1 Tax=Myceligenerans crystallogenes TaxID=316335 RepID=A0ABN2N2T7_9MICO